MTRYKWWLGIGLTFALLIIIAILLVPKATASTSLQALHPGVTPPHFNVSQTYVTGGSAIPVHVASGATANYANTSLTPNFTENDVETFLNQHGFYAGPLIKGAKLKILTLQFVTAKQASTLMAGESVGRPDNYLVCYVKVQGPFQLTQVHAGPPNPGTKKKAETTAMIGDAVFDGHTGNILVWGIY